MPNPRKSKLTTLLKHDTKLLSERPELCRLVGLDEVGRGSLISGVVGGAVWIPTKLNREQKTLLKWLDDSKKLTANTRKEIAEGIHSFCLVGIGIAEKEEVDDINVHYASLLALYRAFAQLSKQAESTTDHPDWFLLMDGRAIIPDLPKSMQKAIIKGDGLSASIAAASVVAKVYRDNMVQGLAKHYPGYEWEHNMGYATPAHLRGIRELGITPLHRKNFKQAHQQLLLPLDESKKEFVAAF